MGCLHRGDQFPKSSGYELWAPESIVFESATKIPSSSSSSHTLRDQTLLRGSLPTSKISLSSKQCVLSSSRLPVVEKSRRVRRNEQDRRIAAELGLDGTSVSRTVCLIEQAPCETSADMTREKSQEPCTDEKFGRTSVSQFSSSGECAEAVAGARNAMTIPEVSTLLL